MAAACWVVRSRIESLPSEIVTDVCDSFASCVSFLPSFLFLLLLFFSF